MHLVLFNLGWMTWNVFLAFIPVFFGWLMVKAHTKIAKIICGIFWLVFLPNTIYLLTDIIHLPDDWVRVYGFDKVLMLVLYTILMILGIVTFVLSLHPLEKLFKRKMQHKTTTIVLVNFIIGFGIVLGRVERTNSWDIFVNFPRFLNDVFSVITSPEKLLLCLAFGILCNIVYFSCRRLVMKEVYEIEKL
jgi:uncharacterized membrane protein